MHVDTTLKWNLKRETYILSHKPSITTELIEFSFNGKLHLLPLFFIEALSWIFKCVAVAVVVAVAVAVATASAANKT